MPGTDAILFAPFSHRRRDESAQVAGLVSPLTDDTSAVVNRFRYCPYRAGKRDHKQLGVRHRLKAAQAGERTDEAHSLPVKIGEPYDDPGIGDAASAGRLAVDLEQRHGSARLAHESVFVRS